MVKECHIRIYFIYLGDNRLLANILKMHHLLQLINASVISINETKLDGFVLRVKIYLNVKIFEF